ncbi:3-dehydroquinate synthase, partial [Candidatus Pacearchaeota archaeon]|nr:3-dehydroquinate synthase [Candidatus Pacearchaeota archaeon]
KEYPGSRVIIITDSTIDQIYGKEIKANFTNALYLVVPEGEESKDFKTVIDLSEQLVQNGITRHDVILGLGGGMVTDLAGFVASIYMRGMNYMVMPTTLLGMVDAAIGGKTGIDFHGKNLIGTIYLADFVLIDPDFLKSFPDPHKLHGMGEVIKYAGIINASLFEDFEKKPMDIVTIIEKSAQAKTNVVMQDLREEGMRKILNFGHTFGHAIELAMNFKLHHDKAISIGMVLANQVAQNLGKQDAEIGNKIKNTLEQFGLPTELPSELTLNELAELIKKDKKRKGEIIDFIVVTELGKTEIIPLKPEELVKLAA